MTEKQAWLSGTKHIDSNQRKQKRMRMDPPAGVRETVSESRSGDVENDCEFTIRLNGPIDMSVEEEYKRVIAKAFYATGWSFNSVDKKEVKDMLQFFAKHVSLPNRHDLADPHLTREYIDLKVHVIKFIKANIPYIVIVTDGWTNPNHQSVINIILTGPKMRPVYWSSVALDEEQKTGEFLAELLLNVKADLKEALGSDRVCGVVTDNAPNMLLAAEIMEASCEGFFATGCAAHIMNLVLKDIFKIQEVARVLKKSHAISEFIRGHPSAFSRFKTTQMGSTETRRRAVKLSCPTRWFSSQNCVQSVIDNKDTICAVFADATLMTRFKTSAKLPATLSYVNDIEFWRKGKEVLKLLRPAHECLVLFESDECSISLVFQQFKNLMNHTSYASAVPGTKQTIRENIKKRWDEMHSVPMKIAYLLDHTGDRTAFSAQEEEATKQQVYAAAGRMKYSAMQAASLHHEVADFIALVSDWPLEVREEQVKYAPFEWWGMQDKTFPLLRPIARRIFSIPSSSAASERSWSSHGYIHSDRRNRLEHERVDKSLFVYANSGDISAQHEITFDAATNESIDAGLPSSPSTYDSDREEKQDESLDRDIFSAWQSRVDNSYEFRC